MYVLFSAALIVREEANPRGPGGASSSSVSPVNMRAYTSPGGLVAPLYNCRCGEVHVSCCGGRPPYSGANGAAAARRAAAAASGTLGGASAMIAAAEEGGEGAWCLGCRDHSLATRVPTSWRKNRVFTPAQNRRAGTRESQLKLGPAQLAWSPVGVS